MHFFFRYSFCEWCQSCLVQIKLNELRHSLCLDRPGFVPKTEGHSQTTSARWGIFLYKSNGISPQMSTKDRRQVVKDGQNLVNVVCERSRTGRKGKLGYKCQMTPNDYPTNCGIHLWLANCRVWHIPSQGLCYVRRHSSNTRTEKWLYRFESFLFGWKRYGKIFELELVRTMTVEKVKLWLLKKLSYVY